MTPGLSGIREDAMTDQFLRMKDVRAATGLGPSTIYRLVQQGRFPKPVHPLGNKTSAWLASEVAAWQHEAIKARGKNGKVA